MNHCRLKCGLTPEGDRVVVELWIDNEAIGHISLTVDEADIHAETIAELAELASAQVMQ